MTVSAKQKILIDGYQIDASLSESHDLDSDVTEYPVETGSSITDNTRPKPITVTIEGIVSDTPLGPVADLRHNESGPDGSFTPSTEALAVLEGIRSAREPVSITTTLRTFDNMVMTSLSIPRDAATGAALRFSATFTEVIFVTNNRTTVRVATPSNGKQQNLGHKGASPWLRKQKNVAAKEILWHQATPAGGQLKPGDPTVTIKWANNAYGGNVFLRAQGGFVYATSCHDKYGTHNALDALSNAEFAAFNADTDRDKKPFVGTYKITRLPDPYPPN
jgi:hypothetical protein